MITKIRKKLLILKALIGYAQKNYCLNSPEEAWTFCLAIPES